MTYSDAPRCADCDGRASLTEAVADALATGSVGGLAAFACRSGNGWHVWCPRIERIRR
ncbi:MAG TPA: hypothetical protein VHV74_08755 [Pseudonocardiaceae bacterium]|jgi:hypothetical protein|nr:hypothetical protein [Pseudonocardiaceae bacterium]